MLTLRGHLFYNNSISKLIRFPYMNPTERIINRILEVDNFQNMACCCDDFADFVTEILEWGVDHIAGVDFFDTYKSYREFTFNPELDIKQLDAFIKAENGYIR